MEKVEQILQDDAILVQPFSARCFCVSNKVRNFSIHPTLYHRFHNVRIG